MDAVDTFIYTADRGGTNNGINRHNSIGGKQYRENGVYGVQEFEPLAWHIRLIDRLITTNPNATISDYFKITNGYEPENRPRINHSQSLTDHQEHE